MRPTLRIFAVLALVAAAFGAQAQRGFNQAELDTLLAPVALYPDPLLAHVLNAAVYPQDVAIAAAWQRANPGLQGDDALRAVEREPWHPSVKALLAYPDVLARMAESPRWLASLGEAYLTMPANVDATVQQLRARAEASGYLRSDNQQHVYRQGEAIVVQPVDPYLAYAPYYNPYVVYGGWWWPAYRPVYWRPWVARPVIVTRVVQVPVHPHRHHRHRVEAQPHRAIPESRRAPIVQSPAVLYKLPSTGAQPVFAAPQAQAHPKHHQRDGPRHKH